MQPARPDTGPAAGDAPGFRREGYLRQRGQVGTELQDSVILGLLANDWSAAL